MDSMDPKIDALLDQYEKNRVDLKNKLTNLEQLSCDVNNMFPKNTDFRNRYILDDKLKVMSHFYSTMLSFTQEINRSIKDEIEIRRRNSKGVEEDFDIRKVAKILDKENLKLVKKNEEKEASNG